MHYLYLKDLIEQAGVKLVSLGSGDFSYKRWFGNVVTEEGSIFLFRRSILNHVRYAAHVGLRSVVKYIKRGLSRFDLAPVSSPPIDSPRNPRSATILITGAIRRILRGN
jgi:hypothetical protein